MAAVAARLSEQKLTKLKNGWTHRVAVAVPPVAILFQQLWAKRNTETDI